MSSSHQNSAKPHERSALKLFHIYPQFSKIFIPFPFSRGSPYSICLLFDWDSRRFRLFPPLDETDRVRESNIRQISWTSRSVHSFNQSLLICFIYTAHEYGKWRIHFFQDCALPMWSAKRPQVSLEGETSAHEHRSNPLLHVSEFVWAS